MNFFFTDPALIELEGYLSIKLVTKGLLYDNTHDITYYFGILTFFMVHSFESN